MWVSKPGHLATAPYGGHWNGGTFWDCDVGMAIMLDPGSGFSFSVVLSRRKNRQAKRQPLSPLVKETPIPGSLLSSCFFPVPILPWNPRLFVLRGLERSQSPIVSFYRQRNWDLEGWSEQPKVLQLVVQWVPKQTWVLSSVLHFWRLLFLSSPFARSSLHPHSYPMDLSPLTS